jgi:hypothetical protein
MNSEIVLIEVLERWSKSKLQVQGTRYKVQVAGRSPMRFPNDIILDNIKISEYK